MWPARRSAPPLSPGTIHIWTVSLDHLLGQAESYRTVFAADELDRATRFHFERDRARYIIGRGVLRRLLASYCNARDPGEIAFDYGPHGKPALKGDARVGEALRFNLAHTGGFALFAFARSVELGVDVERVHDISDLQSLMRSCFATRERAEISALPTASDQREAFFRCWTRKEAVLKALGSGLAKALDSFDVSTAEERARVLSMSGGVGATDEWQLLHLTPAPGFVGAAAWIGPGLAAECFVYEP